MDTNLKPPFRVKKENIGSGQYLISTNENGFFQTRGRLYDEEAAEVLKEALEARAKSPAEVACRLPLVALDLPAKPPSAAMTALNEKITRATKGKKKAKRRARA